MLTANSDLGEAVSLEAGEESKDEEEAMVQETAELLASLSDVILSPIKPPKINSNSDQESDANRNTTEVR